MSSNYMLLHDRPVHRGFYRAEIHLDQPAPFTEIKKKIDALGPIIAQQYEASRQQNTPGIQKIRFGAFAAPNPAKGGGLEYLDSTKPISDWIWPAGSQFYPGAAIVHAVDPGAGQGLVCDYFILYLEVLEEGKAAPDGSAPKLSMIDKNTGAMMYENTASGKRFEYPFTPQQKQLGAWQVVLYKMGLVAIDLIALYCLYAAGVLQWVAEIFFNFLGEKVIKPALPVIAVVAGLLVASSLAK